MEMMLDKKNIQAIFLLKFKMGHKTGETNHNINYAFDQGTAKKYIARWWFKKFGKGDKSLEDEECSGQPLEVDNDQLEIISEGGPLTTTREVAEELNINRPMVI